MVSRRTFVVTSTLAAIAIVWPTDHAPVLIAAYLTVCTGPEAKRNSVLARVGQAVAQCVESK
jgi:hypothetical protein